MEKKNVKDFQDFKSILENNADLQQQFQANPVEAIQQFDQGPLDTDPWIYRIVVLSMGLAIILIIISVTALMLSGQITTDKTVPTIFTALGSAAIGALAGLLAPSPKKG